MLYGICLPGGKKQIIYWKNTSHWASQILSDLKSVLPWPLILEATTSGQRPRPFSFLPNPSMASAL